MDGRSHTIAFCPTCGSTRTFNPDRCVVCGHQGGEQLRDDSNVVALRHRDIDEQHRSRAAGRRFR